MQFFRTPNFAAVLSFPNCKINLGLRIHRRRTDGYHGIESVFYPVPWCDALEIIPSEKFSFEHAAAATFSHAEPSHSHAESSHSHAEFISASGIKGTGSRNKFGMTVHGIPKQVRHDSDKGVLVDSFADQNLCVKAYYLLQKEFHLKPVNIFLLKKIPLGSGLGGGSSDAWFTLQMLNELFELRLEEKKLFHYAALLGSDVPFFQKNIPMLVTGRGEEHDKINLDLSRYHITIVVPDVQVSTKWAYETFDSFRLRGKLEKKNHTATVDEIIQMPVKKWKQLLTNDFEEVVFKKFPLLKEIKDKLYASGAVYASMSGSGSAVYGIFKTPPEKLSFRQSFTVFNSPL